MQMLVSVTSNITLLVVGKFSCRTRIWKTDTSYSAGYLEACSYLVTTWCV